MLSKVKNLLLKVLKLFPKVTKDIVIYGVGGSMVQFVGLITIPIITRILISNDVGKVDVINAISGYFLVLIPLNLVSGLMRYFYEVSEDAKNDRKKMISSAIWFTTIFGALIVWLVSLFSKQLSVGLFDSPAATTAIVLAVASLPFTALKEIFASVLRMERKPIVFLILNIIYAVINFLLILFFILGLKKGIEGYFTAQIISGLFITLTSAWFCRSYLGLTFSFKWFWVMAAYALPMLPGGLLNQGMMSINRILLTQFTTESQIAYFGVATKAAKVVELAVTAFIMGWLPIFLANINSESFHKKLDRVFRYYFYGTLVLSAVITTFAKEFFFILAPAEYAVGASLVALLCLKQVITGSTYTFTVGITQKKKTYLVSVSTAFGVAATILFSYLLSPRYGIFGAAIADVIGIAIYTLAMLLFSNHLVKLDLNYKPVIFSMAAFLVMWLITIEVEFPNYWLDFAFRLGSLAAFLLFVFVIIDQREILKTLSASLKSILPETSNYKKDF